jgi:hypothetical protein
MGLSNFFAFIGATVGSWVGWAAGDALGFGYLTLYVLSCVGGAAGLSYGRRFAIVLVD